MPIFHKWGGGIGAELPRVADAYDEFLVLANGDEVVDAAAGAAVANLGHSLSTVPEVSETTLSDVGYLSLSHFTHEAPERLAERLASVSPGDLNAAFLVGSGSEANETAIKLARAYHTARGAPRKSVVIGRWQSYHGSTLGALSVSGHSDRRRPFDDLLLDWPHIPPAYPFRWNYSGSPEEQAIASAGELEKAILRRGPENVAGFIAEPVGGSSIPAAQPHPAYFREIRKICDEYDVLFIADEVMTGFGRTGERFAIEHSGVVPDIMTIGKAMSGGYAPISAALVRTPIAAEFASDGDETFEHGHTYSGHPATAAVAADVVDRYTEDVLAQADDRGRQLASALEQVEQHPMVGDLRRVGLLLGVEFVADPDTDRPFDPSLDVSERVFTEALDRGVYVYPGGGSVDGAAGDHVMLAPPLTIERDTVDTIASAVQEAVKSVWDGLG